MRVLLLLCFTSIPSAKAASLSRDLVGLNEFVNADGEPLFGSENLFLADSQNENQEADLAAFTALPGAEEDLFAETPQTLDGIGGELNAQNSEVLAGTDEGLGFEESSLAQFPNHTDSELSAGISCEPPGSPGSAKNRKRGQNQPAEQCFDNSGGICPRDKPNLLCCEEPVMYTHVLIRGCVICE